MFEPNTKRRKNLVALREYVAKQTNGARVSWVEIEQATGVEMSGQLNRNLFRDACHREKRAYLPLPGGGVEFSSVTNATECVDRYNKRVVGSIKAAAEKSAYVVERHVSEMTGDKAKELLRKASLASMLSLVAKTKREASKQSPALPKADKATG